MPINMWDIQDDDHVMMRRAKMVASYSMNDRKVGCVVVTKDDGVTWGYNQTPRFVDDLLSDHEPGVRDYLISHAEEQALTWANVHYYNATLYATMWPCAPCVRLLLNQGVARLVAPVPQARTKWIASQRLGIDLMARAGIVLVEYEGE